MSSVEQALFNEFAERKVPLSDFGSNTRVIARQAWIAAWRARDAEVSKLRAMLAVCKSELCRETLDKKKLVEDIESKLRQTIVCG